MFVVNFFWSMYKGKKLNLKIHGDRIHLNGLHQSKLAMVIGLVKSQLFKDGHMIMVKMVLNLHNNIFLFGKEKNKVVINLN